MRLPCRRSTLKLTRSADPAIEEVVIMSEKSLQEQFIESKGAPILVNGQKVVQMDCIPIFSGVVTIHFLGANNRMFGVAMKSPIGRIELSDGTHTKTVISWDEPGMPRSVEYAVACPDGELRLWNVYRVVHLSGEITEDAWTGNAGMLVETLGGNTRRYKCSSGPGKFSPDEFSFEVAWSAKD
jgi:hypothetical protein